MNYGLFVFSKKYYKKYKIRLFIGFFLILISNILSLFPIYYIGKSINTIKYLFTDFSNKKNILYLKKHIFIYSSIIIIVPIIGGYVKYHMRKCIITTSRMIEFDIKNKIFLHYQKLSSSFYKNNTTGDLMNRLTEDVSLIRQYIGPGIMYIVNLIVLFLMVFIKMLQINIELTFYVIFPIPILFIFIYYISFFISKKSIKAQKYQSILCSFIHDTFSGIHIIKSFVSEKSFKHKYINLVKKYKKKNVELTTVDTILSSIIIFFIGISNFLIIFFGGKKYLNGEIKEIGVIAEFFTYINILVFPFLMLSWVISILERAKISQIRINEFLKVKPDITCKKKYYNTNITGKIQFKNVSFSYINNNNKNKKIISKISFTLINGKILVLTGDTGSGKTTICRLLSRLYDPCKGNILIDNIPLRNYNLHKFRMNLGYVPQESFIFSDTIYNNIAIGCIGNVHPNKVYDAARKAMIEQEILCFKNGYNTIIGENGINLSGGQKQRICIARAMIRSPKILIFDDSFSAIDQKIRKSIINHINIDMYLNRNTVIIITHDISYIKNFDLHIILKNGSIFKMKKKNMNNIN
ncbi:ABC transporter ATP-binding protein [Blattabacterium cuenoti]|uniref:ABC transporter ATP-binding protein n=1 Tax=Blattabacterium cuenoti TaxID=1653831 RepID=UPI00163C1BE7|nr:ABC transporter ATP-binding protein [Blattabacterium cuenoti]